jgi:hypothetical protein
MVEIFGMSGSLERREQGKKEGRISEDSLKWVKT